MLVWRWISLFFFCLCEMFTVMYFDLVSVKAFFFFQTPNMWRAKHQRHPDCFIPAEKSWKYFCVVRWISRLYSLQCFPLNSPSAIPETTTSPCLLPVPGKYKVECFFWPSRSTLCPWRARCLFEIPQSNTTRFSFRKCCWRRWGASERKVFMSHFCCFSFFFCL